MNKGKTTFIFFSGFMLHEVLVHWWLSAEGFLPLTSRLFFDLTITPAMNTAIIAIDIALMLICVYMGFFYSWQTPLQRERHA